MAAGDPITAPRVFRWSLAFVGILCVALGAIGVVVPGLPTTGFLVAACWCFARSCPWLEDRLVRNRFFGPFLRYLQPGAVMPMRARLITLAVLWTSVGISIALMVARERPPWIIGIVAAAAMIGSICVWRVARPR